MNSSNVIAFSPFLLDFKLDTAGGEIDLFGCIGDTLVYRTDYFSECRLPFVFGCDRKSCLKSDNYHASAVLIHLFADFHDTLDDTLFDCLFHCVVGLYLSRTHLI